jgi:hypothetical protein
MEAITFSNSKLPLRFWNKIQVLDNGCWEWVATCRNGYGLFRINGELVTAHRLAYEKLIGPFPVGLVADHLCRNCACVNPYHIEPVTQQENILRGRVYATMKIHCAHGHPYSATNTYYRPDGYRACRACHCENERIRRLHI